MDVRQLIGVNVRRLRRAAGLTQAVLAIRMDVDRGYVSGLERGKHNPTALTLWHIALALNVRIADLFEEVPSAPQD
jgi:transcriptional regulator with XRE-family HTH domain